LKETNVAVEVVFVDTSVGLPEVRKYVKDVSHLYGWRLRVFIT
jgi:3'-phosphoadenosine 5'-phosphosulfate sulfotransferase (PAPS reductase)/FAD synthetase